MKSSITKLTVLSFVCLLLLNQSCKKIRTEPSENEDNAVVNYLLEQRFYNVGDSSPVIVKKIAAYLQSSTNRSAIAAKVINDVGFPLWDKSLFSSAISSENRAHGKLSSGDTNMVFIPIVPPGTQEVEGALACRISGDSVSVTFLNEKHYKFYGFDTANAKNANQIVGLMMLLQNQVFGTQSFVLNDGRLFSKSYNNADSASKKLIKIDFSKNKSKGFFGEMSKTTDYEFIGTQICFTSAPLSQSRIAAVILPVYCFTVFTSELSPGGSSGGWVYPSEGTNGGGSGSSSSASYLQQVMGIPDIDLSFLNSEYELSLEAFNYYLSTEDGSLTYLERRSLLISHLLLLRDDLEYRDYCKSISSQNADIFGKYYPWFKTNVLQATNLLLASNIQMLNLHIQQAYYLLKNPSLNIRIATYLLNSNGQTIEEKKMAVVDHLNGMLTDEEYRNFVADYEMASNSNEMWWENNIWLNNTNNFYLNVSIDEIGNQQYENLTAAEKALVKLYPVAAYSIKQNVNVAFNETKTRFSNIGGFLNGKADAFRHAFFNAMNERDCGRDQITLQSIAKLFSDAHESEVPVLLNLEKQMDLYNNAIGHIVGDVLFPIFTSNISLANEVMAKFNAGELRYLAPLDFNLSKLYDANGDKLQDCSTCFNGILPGVTIMKPTNQ